MTPQPTSYADLLASLLTQEPPPAWRAGQYVFNVLHAVRPDLAEAVRGTALDPFHRDDRLPALLDHLARAWDAPVPPAVTLHPADDPRPAGALRPTADERELADRLGLVPLDEVIAEENARADLLTQLDDVVARLDVVLDTARAAGWSPASHVVDDLYDRLTTLRSDLEEGP